MGVWGGAGRIPVRFLYPRHPGGVTVKRHRSRDTRDTRTVRTAPGLRLLSRSCGCVLVCSWMIVRFVCVIRACPCAPVSPLCVPAPPGVFLPVHKHQGEP